MAIAAVALAALSAAAFATLALAPSAHAAGVLSVSVERTAVTTRLGEEFAFRATVTNPGTGARNGLIAHLNVLSLTPGVEVDPEDWSSDRTRYLATIPAGGSLTLTWPIKAVNAGAIGVYVAVVSPESSPSAPTTGPMARVTVVRRQTLNSGGVLWLVIGVPVVLSLLAIATRFRRTRRS